MLCVLHRLGQACMAADPKERPAIAEVHRQLDVFMRKLQASDCMNLANCRATSCPAASSASDGVASYQRRIT